MLKIVDATLPGRAMAEGLWTAATGTADVECILYMYAHVHTSPTEDCAKNVVYRLCRVIH